MDEAVYTVQLIGCYFGLQSVYSIGLARAHILQEVRELAGTPGRSTVQGVRGRRKLRQHSMWFDNLVEMRDTTTQQSVLYVFIPRSKKHKTL